MAELTGPAWPASAQRLRVGEIEIDLRYRSVQRDGATHELNPRCFDLLLLFLREPGILHSREAIFRKVWPGVVVEDANLSNSIWMLRRAFGAQARQWIRTVSKQGYIFDPPATVTISEWPLDAARAATAPKPAGPIPAFGDAAASLARSSAHRRRWSWGLTVSTALLALWVGGTMLRVVGSSVPVSRVALIMMSDEAMSEQARWPSRLLHAWIEWQLRSVSGIEWVGPAERCDGCAELAVLVNVGMPAERHGEWEVSARFRGSSAPADIHRRCSEDRLVATIGEVSREVLAAVAPSFKGSLPELRLDAGGAAGLVDGLAAEQRGNWGEAAHAFGAVVERAPEFGFARVHLANDLSRMGQQSAAKTELARASAWVNALPDMLQQPLKAQELLITRDFTGAAAAYAALVEDGGSESLSYRLAEATSLRRAGRSRDAARRLEGELPQLPSIAVRWLIERAETEVANRDLANAAANAADAIQLAGAGGWEHERARAAMVLADVQVASGKPADEALFEQATQGFERAGDKLGVLRARVYRELTGAEASAHLDELLAEARLAGNASLEIDALKRAAQFNYRKGDVLEAHARLEQAAAVAESGGSAHERRLAQLGLLREDTLQLDFAALDRRLTLLRSQPLQGGMSYSVGLNASRLQYLRGDFDAALKTLAQTEDDLRDPSAGNLPQLASALGCMRIAVHEVQGNTALARNDIRDCRASGIAIYDHYADIAEVELAIHTGDMATARKQLWAMRGMLGEQTIAPDRWQLVVEVAPLLARSGDLDGARVLIDDVLPAVSRSGYRFIEADLRTTLAEISLALGQPDEAEREIAISDAMVPADDWFERRRLRTVRALLAQADGRIDDATHALDSLHADAVKHGDVLAELLVHSLVTQTTMAGCTDQRRVRLLAQSGLRGASDLWMEPNVRESTAALASIRP
ncbi:MAG: winged helix-turn-helix domain-containing protein [Dokdonella sp.]